MAKIGMERAVKYFTLDPDVPTGLRWRIDNPRKGSRQKAGDPVGFRDRVETGYIPLAEVRVKLKERAHMDIIAADKKRKSAAKQIASIRRAIADDEPAITDEDKRDSDIRAKAKARYDVVNGELMANYAIGSYEEGEIITTPYLCFGGYYLDQANTIRAIMGKPFSIFYTVKEGERSRDVADRLNGSYYCDNGIKRLCELLKAHPDKIEKALSEINRVKSRCSTNS